MIASRRPNPSSIYFSTMLKFFESTSLFHKNPIFPNNSPKPPISPFKSFNFPPRNSFSTTAAVDANPFSKASRNGRVDAQNALFDYLHYTDAEYVSKNSPDFLQSLLSKLDGGGEEDVGRSVTRFLRYDPINEFEPFFESLGLKPAELPPLLGSFPNCPKSGEGLILPAMALKHFAELTSETLRFGEEQL